MFVSFSSSLLLIHLSKSPLHVQSYWWNDILIETGTTCTLDSSDLQSSPWISAWFKGSSLSSTSTSATITQHDFDSYRQFTFDLSSASLSTDTNPFVAAGGST